MEQTVRAKMICNSVTKTVHWEDRSKHLYTAKFNVVHSGSKENDRYFDATPAGTIELGTFKEDHFKVGQEYYLDFIKAE